MKPFEEIEEEVNENVRKYSESVKLLVFAYSDRRF